MRLAAGLHGTLAVYDPDGVADALFALHPEMPAPIEVYVHDTERLGLLHAGCRALPLTDLPHSGADTLLVASFDSSKLQARPAGAAARPHDPRQPR